MFSIDLTVPTVTLHPPSRSNGFGDRSPGSPKRPWPINYERTSGSRAVAAPCRLLVLAAATRSGLGGCVLPGTCGLAT